MVNLKNDFFLLDIINQNSNICLHTNCDSDRIGHSIRRILFATRTRATTAARRVVVQMSIFSVATATVFIVLVLAIRASMLLIKVEKLQWPVLLPILV